MGLIILAILFSIGNSEFLETAEAQKKAGFKWHELPECRQVVEGLPAITIDTVQGEKVCYKLALTRDGAK
jgi:hypothetical protein|tara:strand:+ start:1182 stop:1391 length:210 start_codon:yes stop_codon:yes gene_type:complete